MRKEESKLQYEIANLKITKELFQIKRIGLFGRGALAEE